MADSPVYVLASLVVTDAREYQVYQNQFLSVLSQHDGILLGFEDSPESLEGKRLSGRVVIVRFPSDAHARHWYHDPTYQAIAGHRRSGSKLDFIALVHGLG